MPLIQAEGVTKSFGGARALTSVGLSLEKGEVHSLVGENGAGKSTLGKCLAGVLRPDEGTILVDGEAVDYRHPRDALRDGITIVEQELALLPAMTVADNILVGDRRRRRNASKRSELAELCEQFGIGLDLRKRVEDLSAGEQQKVEILRALSRQARLIVMDEPTARLPKDEAEHLLEIIRQLAGAGTTVLFVSHFLEEVLSISSRVTIMRNGRIVRTAAAADETPETLVTAMLGRSANLAFPEKQPVKESAPVVLSARGLRGRHVVTDVSLSMRAGEIVGLGGLVGSGRSEVAKLLFGAERRVAGSIEIDGKAVRLASVRDALGHGVAYLPENRKDLGLFLELSARTNTTLPHLDAFTRLGYVDVREERRQTKAILEELTVTPNDPDIRVGSLSGGNQQKVLFAKWLLKRPRLLIADEPTRGVDVGAKFAIYRLLVQLASTGMAILLISSELDELVGLSHRVIVMARGKSVVGLSGDDVSEGRILHAAFKSTSEPVSTHLSVESEQ